LIILKTPVAQLIQQQYAIRNPLGFKHYSQNNWGFTAGDGPGPANLEIEARKEYFMIMSPGFLSVPMMVRYLHGLWWSSLPFAPDIVLKTSAMRLKIKRKGIKNIGFDASFNPSLCC
jgi:hypothetical protein